MTAGGGGARLWDRGTALDAAIERFTVGRDPEIDLQLVAFDALGSAAHAVMLERIGVLGSAELTELHEQLRQVVEDARAGKFAIAREEEDCHTAIENRLTARLGNAGRRIHTGRSRNDQVIAALRLYARERLIGLARGVLQLARQLLAGAEKHRETTVAGYTHTRQAMPSTIGHLFAAHAEALLDALPWFQTAYAHINRSPLGSASGYGVALALDRQLVADLLGFDSVQRNTLAVQSDRGRSEYLVLAVVAAVMSDLSRLASDLIWYSSDELGFVRLAPEVTTGSSIMPNKRNPDVLELVRASAARLRSRQAEVGAVYGGLSSGYHRDLQLTKEPFVESLQLATDAAQALLPVLQTLDVDAERCRAALNQAIGATDALYRRVATGEPFRSAYKAVAADPVGAVVGDPSAGWRARTHLGAPGALDLLHAHAAADVADDWLGRLEQCIADVWASVWRT